MRTQLVPKHLREMTVEEVAHLIQFISSDYLSEEQVSNEHRSRIARIFSTLQISGILLKDIGSSLKKGVIHPLISTPHTNRQLSLCHVVCALDACRQGVYFWLCSTRNLSHLCRLPVGASSVWIIHATRRSALGEVCLVQT